MSKALDKFLAERAARLKEESARQDDPANKTLDREYDAQFHLATPSENVVLVAIKHLRSYSNHPFKAYSDDKLTALAESIERDGLQQPIIIRPVDGAHGYEILAGHNRVAAIKDTQKQIC